MESSSTWIWAVDPLSADPATLKSMATLIQSLRGTRSIRVVPVAVASPDYLNWPQEFSTLWTEAFVRTIREALLQALAPVQFEGLDVPEIVSVPANSRKESAFALSTFVSSSGADLVFLSTHSRKGPARFVLGSFTESFIGYAKVPVICVNPRTQMPTSVKKIFFPSDFSEGSYAAFGEVLNFATEQKAEVLLYHRFALPVESVREAGIVMSGGGWMSIDQFLIDDERFKRREALEWVSHGHSLGVQVTPILENSGQGLAEGILEAAAKAKADFICVDFHSGPKFGGFFGSAPREIVRDSSCPVFIFATPRSQHD